MIDEDTPDQACSIGGCPSVTEICSYSMSCPSATEHGDGVIIVGRIAAGLAQQVRRADGRILSETIAPNETAVLIPSSLLSELPEVKRLREVVREFLVMVDDSQGYYTMIWSRSELVRMARAALSEAKSSSPQAEEKA